MKLLIWLEDLVDKLIPMVKVISRSKAHFTQKRLEELVSKILIDPEFTLRTKNEFEYIINFSGKTCSIIFIKDESERASADIKRLNAIKSKFKFSLQKDGTLEVMAYEHLVATKTDLNMFRDILSSRLESLLMIIEKN